MLAMLMTRVTYAIKGESTEFNPAYLQMRVEIRESNRP